MKKILLILIILIPIIISAQDNKRLNELPVATFTSSDDLYYLLQGNVSKQVTKYILLKDLSDSLLFLYTTGDSVFVAVRYTPQTSVPTPVEGMIYYNGTANQWRGWNGSQWDTLNITSTTSPTDTTHLSYRIDSTQYALDNLPEDGSGGNVYRSGTPVNNQIGVWANDSTLEGDADMTFDGTNFSVSGNVTGGVFIIGAVSVNGTELDILDGATITTAQLNALIFVLADTTLWNNHIADNTQAHSDYLINNNNDTTSGILNAAGFTIGSAAIGESELEILDDATITTAQLNALAFILLDTTAWNNHVADNTQAHSDYLLNNASDETSGVITATGFTIGAAAITETEFEALDGVNSTLTSTELNRVDGVTSSIQTQLDNLSDLVKDTIELGVWVAGQGRSTDTASFQTTSIYGSWDNDTDTIVVTKLSATLLGSSPSITVDIQWHATLNSGSSTHLNSSPPTITSTTTGDEDTSFDNATILPGVQVWCETPTLSTKPTYMSVTLIGYRK